MADDYVHGEMDVSQHKAAFGGFMYAFVYGTLITTFIVLYPTLVFGADFGWMTALGVTVAVCAIAGYAVKQGALFWISLVACTLIGGLTGLIVSLFAGG
ncbi:MAG: aa3-type cytochrome c oxidase subunit IV [Pseudomonadota bacterium]